MKRLFLILLCDDRRLDRGLAHISSAPHEHPHDASILPDLAAMLLAALHRRPAACSRFAHLGRKP